MYEGLRRTPSGHPAQLFEKPASRMRQMQVARGFTLVELIVILIIIGIIAVVAIPRFRGVTGFNTQGFNDRVMETLRYAQKQAIAKRRNVCITFTASAASFTFASAAGTACDTNLSGPAGENPYTVAAENQSVVLFSPVPAGLTFNALGQPILTSSGLPLAAVQTITISGDGTRTFSVEPDTGYVHL